MILDTHETPDRFMMTALNDSGNVVVFTSKAAQCPCCRVMTHLLVCLFFKGDGKTLAACPSCTEGC